MRHILGRMFVACDVVLAPLVFLSSLLLRTVRQAKVQRMPVARSIFQRLGVLPITTHYYDPWAEKSARRRPLDVRRDLPGIDFDLAGQLALLKRFTWQKELRQFPLDGALDTFHYRNQTYGVGDAECLYSLIRLKRPARIVEIGGGYSTLMAAAAVEKNRGEDVAYRCRHVCIEPYENPWLDKSRVEILRVPLESVDRAIFTSLRADDIVFVDSSHVIRPQGDVLTFYLEVFPTLARGVLVHVHDIFTPRDYPSRWLDDAMLLWNEQYLVEALLSGNRDFKIVASLNMLYHDHRAAIDDAFPMLAAEGGPEPASLWLTRQ